MLADEALRIAHGILNRNSNSPFPKAGKGGKDDAKGKDAKKGVSSRTHLPILETSSCSEII